MNITSTERELHKPGGRNRSCFIFEDLVDPGPINATTNDVYKVCIRKLDMNDTCFVAWRHCQENLPTSSWFA